jgi:RNA polymerase sigma-70 factor, ECF subfamily
VRGARIADLEEVYRLRYARFVRVATAIAGETHAAHDAVQDGFAEALRHRRSYRGEGPLEAWVWRTVVNAARRTRARQGEPAPLQASEPSANGTPVDETGVRAWLATLPERQRLAVFLRYYADLDYRTIAAALEIEVGTVSATLSAAHTALRKALKETAP